MTERSTNPAPQVKVHSRHMTVDADWLVHINERTLQLDRFGNGVVGFDVEITHTRNPSRHDRAWRVDLAAQLTSHVIRASAEAEDPRKAFELARDVLEANLRRAARRHHWSRHGRGSTLKVSRGLI